MPEPFRAALYYAPELDDPLWQAGCAWLGRDPQSNILLAQPDLPGLAALTSDPRRYGFHATLKPPMRLARGYRNFARDVEAFAARQTRLLMPPLAVADLLGFLAICPAVSWPPLDALAAACVRELDAHRVPEDAARQAERAAGRTGRQIQNIAQFGYPYIFEDWRFHMTLSHFGAHGLRAAAIRHFTAALAMPRSVRSLAIFIEPAPGAAFELAARVNLGGADVIV